MGVRQFQCSLFQVLAITAAAAGVAACWQAGFSLLFVLPLIFAAWGALAGGAKGAAIFAVGCILNIPCVMVFVLSYILGSE
jgi:hypothetical protein